MNFYCFSKYLLVLIIILKFDLKKISNEKNSY